MADLSDTTSNMLATALELEEKGRAFYHEASSETNDESAKDFFNKLADQELVHINNIKKIHQSIQAGNGWIATEWDSHADSDLEVLFQNLTAKKEQAEKADSQIISAVKTGIELENSSISFYSRHLEQAQDAIEKEFLSLLIREERKHHRVLTDIHFFYTDPEGWYMEKEKAGLDGV